MNKLNNKAFTLIELIVVIAVLGVLVLLAAPKFLGYTNDAKLAQIKNDVKVVENALAIELINEPEYMDNKEWEIVTLETMNGYVEEGSLFDTKGNVDGELGGEFYAIEDELANTNLKGKFIADKVGKVYYHEDGFGGKEEGLAEFTVTFMDIDGNVIAEENVKKGESVSPPEVDFRVGKGGDELEFDGWDKPLDNITEDITVNPNYKSVWEWVSSTRTGTYYKDDEQGYFKYVGTGESTVEIPHVIQGVAMTSYFNMFNETGEHVKKVISTNENVTNMSYMFDGSQATTLDLSSFDTSSVGTMSNMFRGSQATTLDLSNWNTSSVTNMSRMFWDSQATSLDLSSFDTSNVKSMDLMFQNSEATTIIFSNKFDTSSVTNMTQMFYDNQANTLDLSSFNTKNVTNMRLMFQNSEATAIIFSNKFDTSKVTNMDSMFRGSQATTLDLSTFNTSKVTNMRSMFSESKATTITLSDKFNTPSVTDMSSMFENSQADTLDLSSFDTSKVTSMYDMFKDSQAKSIIFGDNFDTSSVTNMMMMFYRSQATSLDLSSFDTSNVTDMYGMFRGSQATTLDLSNWNTSSVTSMSSMFRESKATTLDLSSFDTSSVTNMNYMFEDSQANTGYARKEYDADRFNNNNTNRPTGLNFIVKQ